MTKTWQKVLGVLVMLYCIAGLMFGCYNYGYAKGQDDLLARQSKETIKQTGWEYLNKEDLPFMVHDTEVEAEYVNNMNMMLMDAACYPNVHYDYSKDSGMWIGWRLDNHTGERSYCCWYDSKLPENPDNAK